MIRCRALAQSAIFLLAAGLMPCVARAQTEKDAPSEIAAAPLPIKPGDTLSGQLNAIRSRKKVKRPVFQLASVPRRLPAPAGLCNLENGPMTFQIATDTDAQAAALKRLLGKQVSLRVEAVACAEEAGVVSEAIVTKWKLN